MHPGHHVISLSVILWFAISWFSTSISIPVVGAVITWVGAGGGAVRVVGDEVVGGLVGSANKGGAVHDGVHVGNIGTAHGGWYSGQLLLVLAVWLMGCAWLPSLLGQSFSNLVIGESLS